MRRLFSQIHTWIAIALGLYVVVLSVSGSVVVFRREVHAWLVPRTVASTAGERARGAELQFAVRMVYPQDRIIEIREPKTPQQPVVVSLERNHQPMDRLFDPYARIDLGDSFPPTVRAMEWLVDLHDNLLAGPKGRVANGFGGLLLLLLVVTGLLVWWPGLGNVSRSLKVGAPGLSRRFARQLHNFLGVTACLMLLIWALTAFYFAFPEPWEGLIDFFDPNPDDAHRPGENALAWLVRLHFGRFGGLGVRWLWALLGLVPVILFISGFCLWWVRTVRRRKSAHSEIPAP